MKIRSLTLENVRKFGGKRVLVDGFGDGISVVSEPNEFGKSTFFDALHALFFEKHGSTKKPVKSLQPHAGGGVKITATVEVEGGLFEVEKRFLAKKGAQVTALDEGRVIARDDEAEAWIASHVNMADSGPAGLLWVRQGVLGLDPADGKPADREKLAEARRDLLSSVAGEIDRVTGGRTMDRILKRCEEDLGRLATGARQSPRGPWKEAVDEEAALATELADLEGKCADLADALEERRRLDDELRRTGDPVAIAARQEDLEKARKDARAAEDHAQQVATARSAHAVAVLELTEARRRHQDFTTAVTQAGAAARDLRTAEAAREAARRDLETAQADEAQARTAFETLEERTRVLRDEVKRAERGRAADRAKADFARVKTALGEARRHLQARSEARARLADNPVTAQRAEAAEAAQRVVDGLTAQVAARRVSVTIDYEGQSDVLRDGASLPGGEPVALSDGDRLEVPGVARLRFSLPETGTEDIAARLSQAEQALSQALATCDAPSLAAVRERLGQASQDEAAAQLADNTLKVLAPEGVSALEAALADARARIDQAPEGPLRDLDEIQRDLDAALAAERGGREAQEGARDKVLDARLALERAGNALTTARDALVRAEQVAGPEAERATTVAELEARVTQASAQEQARRKTMETLEARAPDLETARANLTRAETAHETARKRLEDLRERRAALSARIATRADEGVEERRDEVADRLADVAARAARYEAEVAALLRLRDELQAARDHARDAYFEPIQEELRPLLRILHDDARLDWESDSILPGALERGGAVEDFDTLSGGTQEQIAILTRLAFARLFAKRGDHVPVILDDALVYSDDDRIVKMFTALNRVAANQQIIVFSCRQMAFAGLGGTRPRISVASAEAT